ncbi:hypothetical protein NBRC116592_14070 [Colwellia sp. KU-HH00111]|uniref:hypothetical protein n=1 Tax=Colwellia sp. KU-HH00111 TaxID=3127652 RepID=UPI00310BACEF
MHKLDSARNKTDSIIKSFDVSLMSNTKWIKLLSLLSNLDLDGVTATVKLVWDSEIRVFRLDSNLEFNFDYYESSMESLISGYPKGFYDYKEIEWLNVKAPSETLELINNNLNNIGKFSVNQTIDYIQIFAHKNT